MTFSSALTTLHVFFWGGILQQGSERTGTWQPDSHHRPSRCLHCRLGAPRCVTVTPTPNSHTHTPPPLSCNGKLQVEEAKAQCGHPSRGQREKTQMANTVKHCRCAVAWDPLVRLLTFSLSLCVLFRLLTCALVLLWLWVPCLYILYMC